jgi:hypothetical protein
MMSEHMSIANGADFERLRTLGFTEAEARQLIFMKDHVGEQIEYRELMAEQYRLAFMRWLVEHDRIRK